MAAACGPEPVAASFRPAVLRPQKILCIGNNYRRHIREMGKEIPVVPLVFGKFQNALAAHLGIQLTCNGELRQSSRTSDMVFRSERIVAELSSYFTLEPGDVILTGTPSGVIVGQPEAQRRWLRPGDITVVTVERVGSLQNTFVHAD